ncbi:MAG: FKBP-type peptidyl-prolyl cis-trans isomerase [Candidatus Thorarchaeota archaeon]|nr:FKBP-type peptidyl-prolyl cis-trans isomerase [Candidatus Thorarchaeota archaeon]
MGLRQIRIATFLLLTLLCSSSVLAIAPIDSTWDSSTVAPKIAEMAQDSESLLNLTIPYVDDHYGSPDGIIDPYEYAFSYKDPVTGITVYLEQNSTILYVGLEAATSGWIAFGWKNYTDNFRSDGLNNSDLIFGYAPGEPHATVQRVTAEDSVSVHYELYVRNGTRLESGDVPNDESTTPIAQESLLQAYKDAIIGMRIGEKRHFIIPAEEAYNEPSHPLYGVDLEYIIRLDRINSNYENPADASDIVFSDEYGTSTYQHQIDANQSQILVSGGSDDGSYTRLEYSIQMNSTDSHDIALLSDCAISYPLVLMYGDSEVTTSLPTQHSDWASPPTGCLVPDAYPDLVIVSPESDSTHAFSVTLKLNATDNYWIREAFYKFGEENWTTLFYDFQSTLWESSIDLSDFETGPHTIWFNATDSSNHTSTVNVNITIDRPFAPLLGMKLNVERTYATKMYQTSEMRDMYTVFNNGSAPISAIEFFLPAKYSNRLLDIIAADNLENVLEIVRLADVDGLYHWRVYMYDPVGYQETYTFTVTSFFHSMHILVDFDNIKFEITFPKTPLVPYPLQSSSLVVAFRSGDSKVGDTPEGSWQNLAPMQNEDVTLTMTSYTPLIEAERTTDITIDPWGWLNYRETITLENFGNTKENSFLFTIPEYTTSVVIYDEVGILATSQPGGTWDLNTTVNLQINLVADRFGTNGFWPGYKYTFHIDYTIQASGYETVADAGILVDLPIGTLGDVLQTTHVINVVLPFSVGVTAVESGGYRLLYGVFDTTLKYTFHNTTVVNPPHISLAYYTTISAIARPVVFAMLIGLVSMVYVFYRRVDFIEDSDVVTEAVGLSASRQSGAPPELLSDFAKDYSRKTALSMDLEKLESARRKGKVSKKEFMMRERDIKSQIQEIDSKLPSQKAELMQHGARYRDLISQLELQDEKIEGAKAGLRQLLIRKKKQRISRAAFEKSRQDYLKTIKRATTATDRILMTFQEEAGEL